MAPKKSVKKKSVKKTANKKTANKKQGIITARRTPKHKTHPYDTSIAEYRRVFHITQEGPLFKQGDKSEMARHYDTWRKWVKKHGPNIPYTPTNKKSVKADVVELMLADDDLSDDVKARVLANAVFSSSKSYAGTTKKIYLQYSSRHANEVLRSSAAAVGHTYALSAEVIAAIKSKTQKDAAPFFLDDNNILYFWEGAARTIKHILPKEGAVLDQHTDFTRNDLYAKLRGGRRPAGEAIIEPLQQVQSKKLSKNGGRVSIKEFQQLIQTGVCTVHLLQRHTGVKAKLMAQLAETTAIRKGKKLLPAGLMNVREIRQTEGRGCKEAVAMGVTRFNKKKLLAAGYAWEV